MGKAPPNRQKKGGVDIRPAFSVPVFDLVQRRFLLLTAANPITALPSSQTAPGMGAWVAL